MNSFQLKTSALNNKSNMLTSLKLPKDTYKKKTEKVYTSESNLERHIKKEENYSPPKNQQGDTSRELNSSKKLEGYSHSKSKYGAVGNVSPPRKNLTKTSSDTSSEGHLATDRDLFPITEIKKEPADYDISPPRRRNKSPPESFKLKENVMSPEKMIKQEPNNSDGDISPPRRQNRPPSGKDRNVSSLSKRRNHGTSDEDNPPPRRRKESPQRASRYSSSDDVSPPRRKQVSSSNKIDRDMSPQRKKRQKKSYEDSDGDISPPRNRSISSRNDSQNTKHDTDQSRKVQSISGRDLRDISPPRKARNCSQRENIDTSPKRRVERGRSNSPEKRKKGRQIHSRWGNWSPDREVKDAKRTEKTMSGKRAGLQSAKELSKELAVMRDTEDKVFQNMLEEVSGKNAATVSRRQKTKDPEEEAQKLQKEKEMKEKYDRWGKGLKQVENENQKNADQLYEMSKPLARYADDQDLEKYLKEQERDGDPMLDYIRKKKKKKKVEAGIPGNITEMSGYV